MNRYALSYACISDAGRTRSLNQDNYACDGTYMSISGPVPVFPIIGDADTQRIHLFGVFDGMGGEDCGEIASFLAAQKAAFYNFYGDVEYEIRELCMSTNDTICQYTREHDEVFSMGATAAMVAFAPEKIVICNIGDSKIFRFSDNMLRQVSTDHLMFAPHGHKPPLSQNLGIPKTELIIDPFVDVCPYKDGDVYLICSDGLTDMLKTYEIQELLAEYNVGLGSTAQKLVDLAKANGGKDNITVILINVKA